MKRTFNLLFISVLILNISLLTACKDEDTESENDKVLYDEISAITNYSFYLDNDAVLESSDESPHNDYFRVKFNSTAADALTDNGKLPLSSTFPNGSIIIKELYDSQDGELKLIAVMKKASDNNAANGWLWAEFKPDGTNFYSVDEKGASCVSCHSINDRDYVRVFELFP